MSANKPGTVRPAIAASISPAATGSVLPLGQPAVWTSERRSATANRHPQVIHRALENLWGTGDTEAPVPRRTLGRPTPGLLYSTPLGAGLARLTPDAGGRSARPNARARG